MNEVNEIINELFGIGCEPYLERYNPKFKVREEQNKLILDMLKAFNEYDKKHILMEAPTGTGKTFIYCYITIVRYLVKMRSWSYKLGTGKDFTDTIQKNRIGIVTNNKALQKQLLNDIVEVIIPSIKSYFEYKENEEMLGFIPYLTVGVYKSKSNYLCSKAFNNAYSGLNSDKDDFYNNVTEEMRVQKTNSIDFDMVDLYHKNGDVRFRLSDLQKYDCKNRNCNSCGIDGCKFNKSGKKNHNIMVTNYDYILLLARVKPIDYFDVLILDEVHNLPNKLINRSGREFNLNKFRERMARLGLKQADCKEFKTHIDNVIGHYTRLDLNDITNLTYNISQSETKSIEDTYKNLKKLETQSVLSNEYKRVTNHLRLFYFKNIRLVLETYNDVFIKRILKLLDLLIEKEDVLHRIDEYRILKEYDKMIDLTENIRADDILGEGFEKGQPLTEIKEQALDKLFKTKEIKDLYNELKDFKSVITSIFRYSNMLDEMNKYRRYLKELDYKLDHPKYVFEEKPKVPDVVTISNINNEFVLSIVNDDTVKLYMEFLDSLYNNNKIVYCSATMSIEGNYSFFMSRLGLTNENTYKCYIPISPFDIQSKSYIFLEKNFCLDKFGKETKYKWLLKEKLDYIIKNSDSGSLVLCTSKDDVENAYSSAKRLDSDTYSVHSQYYSSLQTIIQDMYKNEDKYTVVIGNTGFWEGIDFKGDNMTTLILSKLPYVRVNEPTIISKYNRLLFDKIEFGSRKSFKGEHWIFYNNMMKIVFYQGIGRLIRTVTDYGVIVCLFSYENFSRKFSVSKDKHLGVRKDNVFVASDLKSLNELIKLNLDITKNNSKKYR